MDRKNIFEYVKYEHSKKIGMQGKDEIDNNRKRNKIKNFIPFSIAKK